MYDHLATATILERALMQQHLKDAVEIASVVRKRQRERLLRRSALCLLLAIPVLALIVHTRPEWMTHITLTEIATATSKEQKTASLPDTVTPAALAPAAPMESNSLHERTDQPTNDVILQLRMQPTLTNQPTLATE